MSEQNQTEQIKERRATADELKYIDSISNLLAKESCIEKDWIKKVLLLTIPSSPLPTHSEEYQKFPVRLLYRFKPCLFEAMKWLDKDTVQELFSGDLSHLQILEANYKNLINEVPIIGFEDMLPIANEFQTFLQEETKSVIKNGEPSKHFEKSFYLEKVFLNSFMKRPPDSIAKIPKHKYQDRHEELIGGIISKEFLESTLGPQFYREFIEIENQPELVFTPEKLAEADSLMKGLRKKLKPLIGYEPLAALKKYLKANKLKIPADLDERDEIFRANLHLFSQNAFKKIIGLYRAKRSGSVLREVSKLVYTMPHEHLDLIFNGHLGYFGLGEYDFGDQILYDYGQKLILNILSAAALADESSREILADIKLKLEPVIEDFIDRKTGEISPITYSLYQAIDLCGYNNVVWACGQLGKAKEILDDLENIAKKKTGEALTISYQQLKAISDEALLQEYLGRTDRVDDIKTLRSLKDATAIRERFDKSFTEYRCLNTNYGIFYFSSEKRSEAIKCMFKNYQLGEHRTSVRELVFAMYKDLSVDEREQLLLRKGNSMWRLEKGPFKDHPAVLYGMIRAGGKKGESRAYILDFSFEDHLPKEQIELLKADHKRQKEKSREDSKTKKDKKVEKKKVRETVKSQNKTHRRFGDMGGGQNRKKKKSK